MIQYWPSDLFNDIDIWRSLFWRSSFIRVILNFNYKKIKNIGYIERQTKDIGTP